MNRNEFMKQLAYLLQDVADGERAEALQYYEDYFEDAGPEEEGRVIATLGSPEKVAAIIKNGLNGNPEEEGEFTERGYRDDRFAEFNKVPEPRMDFGKDEGTYNYYQQEKGNYDYQQQGPVGMQPPAKKSGTNWVVVILAVFGFLVIGLPLLGGLAGGVFGILGGLIGLIFGLVGVTFAAVISTVVTIAGGIALLFVSPATGLLTIGLGILGGAVSLLLIALNIVVYGTFVPWLIRGIVRICKIPFRKGGSTS